MADLWSGMDFDLLVGGQNQVNYPGASDFWNFLYACETVSRLTCHTLSLVT